MCSSFLSASCDEETAGFGRLHPYLLRQFMLIDLRLGQVSFNLSVPKAQLELGPLNWKGLKVSGFTGMVGSVPCLKSYLPCSLPAGLIGAPLNSSLSPLLLLQVLPGQSGLLGLPEDLDCSDVGPGSDILDVEACEEQAAELAVR